jgi:SpoVK/Ycf46/Vps4 family AAA+-type ATPase
MKYNEKYDLYIDNDYVIYYWNNKLDKLMQRTIYNIHGYLAVNCKKNNKWKLQRVHRIIYETFKGKIPDGYEIDHINTIKTDNRLENLRCVTHKENNNNPLTIKHRSEAFKKALKGNTNARGKPTSEFGMKFKEHYGITRYNNYQLYKKEWRFYNKHNKCSWEK